MTLTEIQKELKVNKTHKNTFGNYNYRNCEDILEAVKPLLGDSILTLSDKMVQVGDRYYVCASATFINDKVAVEVTAYAREAELKKGMDEAQITGSASSYARKYALNGLFLIDDSKDADTDSYSGVQGSTKDIDYGGDDEHVDADGFNRAMDNDRV